MSAAPVLKQRFINPVTDRALHVLEQARLWQSMRYVHKSVNRGGPQGTSVFSTCRSISDFSSKLNKAIHYLICATDSTNRRLLYKPLGRIHIQIFGFGQATSETFQLYGKLAGKVLEEKRVLLIPDTGERRVFCSGFNKRGQDWVDTGFIESFDLSTEDLTVGNTPSILALPLIKPNGDRVGAVIIEGYKKDFLKPHVDMIALSRLARHAAEMFDPSWS